MMTDCPRCNFAIVDPNAVSCASCGYTPDAPIPPAPRRRRRDRLDDIQPAAPEVQPGPSPPFSSPPAPPAEEPTWMRSLDFDPVEGTVVLDWPQPEDSQLASGMVGSLDDERPEERPATASGGPGTIAVAAPSRGTPRDLYRGSLLLLHEQYRIRTGRLKLGAWGVLIDLLHEAQLLGLKRRIPHLELAFHSSPSVDGWGQLRLVEALKGEVKPETPPPSGYLGASNSPPASPATTVVVQGGQQQPEKRGLLARMRGGR